MKTQLTLEDAKTRPYVYLQIGNSIFRGTIDRAGKVRGTFTGYACRSDFSTIAPAKNSTFNFETQKAKFFES
jgi:hypothetical protein